MPAQYLPQITAPDIVGAFQQGQDRGRALQANQLAGQAYGATGADRQSLLGQLAGLDPRLAVGMGNALQAQDASQAAAAKAQQVDHNKKLGGAARYMAYALRTNDPARIQGAWQQVAPYLQELTGKPVPPQWNDSMRPAMFQAIAKTADAFPQEKPIQLSNGAQLVDPTGKVLADNPMEHQPTGELATLEGLKRDPSLMPIYRGMHPQKAAGGGFRTMAPDEIRAAGLPAGTSAQIGPNKQIHVLNKGADGAELSDDASHMLAAAGELGYKIPIPSLGMKSGGARTKYLNTLAEDIKASGGDWNTAVRNMVYGEAGIFGTKQMQKTYGATLMNERSALKQADIALEVSNKFSRGDVQALNQWWTSGKKQFGSVQAQQYANAINTFAEEYAKVMSGSNGSAAATDSARARAHSLINEGLSQGQIQGNIDLMKREMRARSQAQLDAMQEQVKGLRDFGHDTPDESAPGATQQPAAAGGWSIEPVQ